jgi:hypothetical protein
MSLWRRNQTRHDSVGTSSSGSTTGSRKSSGSKQLFSGFVVKIDEDEPRPKSTLRKIQSLQNLESRRAPPPPAAAELNTLPPAPAPLEQPILPPVPAVDVVPGLIPPLAVEMPRLPPPPVEPVLPPPPAPVDALRLPPPPAPVDLPRELPPPSVLYDVAIVGAGPAGLMLA